MYFEGRLFIAPCNVNFSNNTHAITTTLKQPVEPKDGFWLKNAFVAFGKCEIVINNFL